MRVVRVQFAVSSVRRDGADLLRLHALEVAEETKEPEQQPNEETAEPEKRETGE